MPERFALPPMITASSWANAVAAAQRSPRGTVQDEDGNEAPAWTAREALALVLALRSAARATGVQAFPLWYQYAAVAYGWHPENDQIDASTDQADSTYPPEAARLLAAQMTDLVPGMPSTVAARLDLLDRFDDADTQQAVQAALRQDGAEAAFKIPIGCKDPKTGRATKPVRDPKTGKWGCPGGRLEVDDPITAILKSLSKVAVPLAVILIAAAVYNDKRRGRRRS